MLLCRQTVIIPLKYKQGVKGGIYHALRPVLDFSQNIIVRNQKGERK